MCTHYATYFTSFCVHHHGNLQMQINQMNFELVKTDFSKRKNVDTIVITKEERFFGAT